MAEQGNGWVEGGTAADRQTVLVGRDPLEVSVVRYDHVWNHGERGARHEIGRGASEGGEEERHEAQGRLSAGEEDVAPVDVVSTAAGRAG